MSTEDDSRDDWVRVPTSELPNIRLRHVRSKTDPALGVIDGADPIDTGVTGTTEWLGIWHDCTVTAAWNWCALKGAIAILSPTRIRTNLVLIRADGQPEPLMVACIHVYHWIESHPWRDPTIHSLLAED